jgi:hypothetical protein
LERFLENAVSSLGETNLRSGCAGSVPLPEDLTNVDYRNESYYRVGDGDDAEYVHPTLLEERPEGWPDWRPL